MHFFKQKQLLLAMCFALCCMLGACSRNNDQNKISTPANNGLSLLSVIENYYKVATTKVDGTFIFESNLCNNDPSITNIVSAGGVFYDKQGNTQNSGGSISIGGMQVNNHNGTFYIDKSVSQKGLYGTNVTFAIQPVSGCSGCSINGTTATATLYSPKAISITNIPARTPVKLMPNTSTTLTWNPDPLNPNGVVIMAEYIPSRSPNRNIASAGASALIENSELVADNGSTSIPWSFFSAYPVGGHIILWVARGNYTIASNGVYNYTVGGYTAAAVWDVSIPLAPPAINGVSSYSFSTSQTSGGGKITATPGSTVTVTVSAGGSGTGFYTEFDLSGASFSTNSSGSSPTTLTANNNSNTATFIMPSGGSVSWTGLYRALNSYGSGGISVH